jgi:hypothetical protein
MICCCSLGMPMPVSATEKAITWSAWLSMRLDGRQPSVTGRTRSTTLPWSVNLKALERRFLSTCCTRRGSVSMARGRPGSASISNSSPLAWATWRKVRSQNSSMAPSSTSSSAIAMVPDSILLRSRMSLMSRSRSEPPA